MSESQYLASSIALGQGGQITDPKLLEILEHVPILQPRELLKLGIYFVASPSIGSLGYVLWDNGVESIVRHPTIAQCIQKVFAVNIIEYQAMFKDGVEDAGDPDPEDEATRVITDDPFDRQFLFTGIFGVGLLFEKRHLENGDVVFYVVTISPDPNELPEPGASDSPKK